MMMISWPQTVRELIGPVDIQISAVVTDIRDQQLTVEVFVLEPVLPGLVCMRWQVPQITNEWLSWRPWG